MSKPFSKIRVLATAVISATILSATFCTPSLAAEPMLSTGGYATEMHTMEMMKMLDADGNHMVTKAEFDDYYTNIFTELDKNKDGYLNEKEWVGKTAGEKISIATGGYSRELRSMKMMGAMDKDGDHKVSKAEFVGYQETLFTAMDKSGDKQIDGQEWLSKQTNN